MGRISRLVVLGEDQPHQAMVRRYLYRLGHSERDIYFEPVSNGRGCGEQWVRDRYAKAVRAYRTRQAQTALIVAVDADNGNRERRIYQLEDALMRTNLAPRGSEERIVHLIPKRNVETWILNLNGHAVDEISDYKHDSRVEGKIAEASGTLFSWTRPKATIPNHCVESLRLAIPELRRLE